MSVIDSSIINKEEKVKVKVYENFGTGSEYSEEYNIPKNAYITENETLLTYYLFKDPVYQEYFDSFVEIIDKDTDIFIIDSTFADMLQAKQEYMEQQEAEQQAAVDEYMENEAE